MKQIDILYFDGCPSWRRAADDVRRILSEFTIDATVRHVPVETEADARRLGFLGSPTVRVDGVDVDPAARNAATFGLQCRIYESGGRLVASPPVSWIKAALGIAARREQ